MPGAISSIRTTFTPLSHLTDKIAYEAITWVFGYGSLMNDGWENPHGCIRRSHASLIGYRRAFDKASTESRGTKECPAPTLRLVPAEQICRGIAFEFWDERSAQIRKELLKREGRTFPLKEMPVHLDGGDTVTALVPLYQGRHFIQNKTLEELAAMAIGARGIRGTGWEYVRDIAAHLREAGIDDPVVTSLWQEIKRQLP